jgi:hypothetical protein
MTINAKFQSFIRSVQPKVILCEEAGKVLEAHIISALTPSTQHLILIGGTCFSYTNILYAFINVFQGYLFFKSDYEQLRPHITTYNLSCDSRIGKKHSLDKSLFERLVKSNKATCIQLLTQRRMRTREISDLIRYTLYEDLVDDENTARYPGVCGAQHNVYFINHRKSEQFSHILTSMG